MNELNEHTQSRAKKGSEIYRKMHFWEGNASNSAQKKTIYRLHCKKKSLEYKKNNKI